MRKYIFVLFFFPLLLFASWEELFPEGEDPSLFHHVHVISGDLNLCLQEGQIEGAKTLPLMRTYTSAGALERTKNNHDLILKHLCGWMIQGGWNFYSYTHLLVMPSQEKKLYKIYASEKNGSTITYVFSHQDGKKILFLKPEQKFSRCSGVFSARNNPENHLIRLDLENGEAALFLADGGIRVYKGESFLKTKASSLQTFYYLDHEILPSKHRLEYTYGAKKRLEHIALKNPSGTKTFAWLHFDGLESDQPYHFQMSASDGKQATYHALQHKSRFYLDQVQGNFRFSEIAEYVPGRKGTGARMHKLQLGGKTQFSVSYYEPPNEKKAKKWAENPEKKPLEIDKVRLLEAPLGTHGEILPLATFSYHEHSTDVRDSENLLTRYHHDGKKLLQIEYFDAQDRLHSSQKFLWEDERLSCKIFQNPQGLALFAHSFVYDAKGNCVEEKFWGNLTGKSSPTFSLRGNLPKGTEALSKRFTFSAHNLPVVEEEEDGPIYRYEYFADTDLITSKFTCDGSLILIREFFEYDPDHLLIAEIVDDGKTAQRQNLDGVSERRIKRYSRDPENGLVMSISELFWDFKTSSEVLLKRNAYTYSPEKKVSSEVVYDSENNLRFTLYTDYDSHGRIIRKTTPLGGENAYRYDSRGNLLESKEVGSNRKKLVYDAAERPIICEEVDAQGPVKTTQTIYDVKGRVSAQVNAQGNTIHQTYDGFGKCLTTTFPETVDEQGQRYFPQVRFTYDENGNLASSTTPRGETSATVYNAFRKPILIRQPDQTEIRHIYHKNGTLAQSLYPDGTYADFKYDILQRMTGAWIYSQEGDLLSEEHWEYNAFHLVSHTNSQGLQTQYTYDGAGRKILEDTQGRLTRFEYDALGHLLRTQKGEVAHVQLHDVSGNIVEEWTEQPHGNENHTWYVYDQENRKVQALRETSQGKAEDFFSYDREGRLSKHVDPHGNASEFIFEEVFNELGQRVIQKTTFDPLDNATLERYDSANRLTLSQKKDPFGKIVSQEDYFYDRSGNQAKRLSTVFAEANVRRTLEAIWNYDSCGRLIEETESGKKTTRFSYNFRGLIQEKLLPSGKSLYFSYDGLGRMLEQKSSDGTIHYEYAYGPGNNPISVKDFIQNVDVQRTYSIFEELISEIHSTGVSYCWEYDERGHLTHVQLPNFSSILYAYSGNQLASVSRQSSQGKLLYTHRYTAFDPNGWAQEEELIGELGTVKTKRDLFERPQSQASPFHENALEYGPSGLIDKAACSFFESKDYEYDALNQLKRENAHSYSFDSVGNPLQCEVDECNQLLSTGSCSLEYDPDGNPLRKISQDGTTLYSYDALGRLTAITQEDQHIRYVYDPFSRLLSKQTFAKRYGSLQLQDQLYFIYDQEQEIGTLDDKGNIHELKVLGKGIIGEIGGAVALELQGQIFAPLHDLSGNLVALTSLDGKIVENYEFTAFGKPKNLPQTPVNPWRFSSKRHEGNLIFFGMRFYDTDLERWLTPDPSGFADGPNLYVFVLNSPTNRLDLFGLASEMKFPVFRMEVPIAQILNSIKSAEPLSGKFFESSTHPDWVLFCNHLYQLQFTGEELQVGKVDILAHFSELIPNHGFLFSVVTYINGMNTSFDDFTKATKTVFDEIYEGPLCIGIYNRSRGLVKDGLRVAHELSNRETAAVAKTRQFLCTLTDNLHKVNPDALWSHFMFSEGSLISVRAIDGMTPDQKARLNQHFYAVAFGPARPMPKSYGLEAVNYYSHRDGIAKLASQGYLDYIDSNIKMIPSSASWWQKCFHVDHAFHGKTYQKALHDEIDLMRDFRGFYNGKNR